MTGVKSYSSFHVVRYRDSIYRCLPVFSTCPAHTIQIEVWVEHLGHSTRQSADFVIPSLPPLSDYGLIFTTIPTTPTILTTTTSLPPHLYSQPLPSLPSLPLLPSLPPLPHYHPYHSYHTYHPYHHYLTTTSSLLPTPTLTTIPTTPTIPSTTTSLPLHLHFYPYLHYLTTMTIQDNPLHQSQQFVVTQHKVY